MIRMSLKRTKERAVMSLASAQELGKNLIQLGLVSRDDWQATASDLGPGATLDEAFENLERRGLLTAFQSSKLRKGDTAGYYCGRFKVLYKISAGTFARVYRGVEQGTGEIVAIKVLRDRHTLDPENIKQFQREAKLTEALRHPNIVRTHEVGIDPETGQHFIAMEFVEGGNLREFLKIRKKIEPRELLRLAIEMVEGLAYALSRGVTHRDIKPTNILFSATGDIKWVDFGLAGIHEAPERLAIGKISDQLQRTVDYAGLEKATRVPKGDPRSDIFFLGAVLYEMLTGELAMSNTRDRNARMVRARFDSIQPLRAYPEAPKPLADIIDKMLAFRPEQRYQTHEDLLRDLRAVGPLLDQAPVKLEAEATSNVDGFPPGPPRLILVHKSTTVQEILRRRLNDRGYQTVLTADLGRAVSLFDVKPAHCVVFDLETTGRDGIKAYRRLKDRAKADGRKLAGILLANTPEQASWADGLDLSRTAILGQDALTFNALKKVLAKLVPPPRLASDDTDV